MPRKGFLPPSHVVVPSTIYFLPSKLYEFHRLLIVTTTWSPGARSSLIFPHSFLNLNAAKHDVSSHAMCYFIPPAAQCHSQPASNNSVTNLASANRPLRSSMHSVATQWTNSHNNQQHTNAAGLTANAFTYLDNAAVRIQIMNCSSWLTFS